MQQLRTPTRFGSHRKSSITGGLGFSEESNGWSYNIVEMLKERATSEGFCKLFH